MIKVDIFRKKKRFQDENCWKREPGNFQSFRESDNCWKRELRVWNFPTREWKFTGIEIFHTLFLSRPVKLPKEQKFQKNSEEALRSFPSNPPHRIIFPRNCFVWFISSSSRDSARTCRAHVFGKLATFRFQMFTFDVFCGLRRLKKTHDKFFHNDDVVVTQILSQKKERSKAEILLVLPRGHRDQLPT